MKIYALYYKDTFVVAYPNREDCVDYGKKHYEGMEWDCSILEKYIHDYPKFIDTTPNTPLVQPYTIPYTPKEVNIPTWTCNDGPKATYDNGPFAPGLK